MTETEEQIRPTWRSRFMGFIGKYWLPLLWMILAGLDVGYRLLYPASGGRSWYNLTAAKFTALWALLLCGIVYAVPPKPRRVLIILFVAFQSFMCLVYAAMFNMFGTVFSFADLAYTGDGTKFFSLTYLNFRKLLIIMLLAALVGAVLLAIAMPKKYDKRRPLIALAMVAVSLGGLIWLNSSMTESDNEDYSWDVNSLGSTDKELYTNFTDVNQCFHLMGSYQYLFRSFVVTYGIEDELKNGATYEELDAYYAERSSAPHEANDMTGVFKGKNVMLFLLESIDTWLLTEDYMPNLYALQQAGINFENHYSPMFISAGTFGTEFTVNTGLVAPTNGISNSAYSTYAFPFSLANLFENEGYTANSFHSSSGGIYNRGVVHINWGYEKYHSWYDMGMEDYQRDSEMINGYDLMVAPDKYFDFILTYSGHGPYTADMDNICEGHWEDVYRTVDPEKIPADGADLQEYYRAVAHAMETDAFIGELIDKMEADGRINDTVFIFFTDHYCKYMSNTGLVMQLKDVDNMDMLCQTPFFIYSKDMEPRTVTKLTSTMDIAPTIANLFDLDVNYAYYTGDDIFSDGGGYVIFRGLNWYDGDIYYTPDYDGEMTDDVYTYIYARNTEVSTRINASWDTFRSNYFATLTQ